MDLWKVELNLSVKLKLENYSIIEEAVSRDGGPGPGEERRGHLGPLYYTGASLGWQVTLSDSVRLGWESAMSGTD